MYFCGVNSNLSNKLHIMTSLCHKSMQALRLVALVVLAVSGIANGYANDHFATIFESGLPYKEQSWFYSGELDQDKIKKYWDEGKRITSVAYTDKGWFVVMAKNSGYTMQTYHYDTSWPSEWLDKKIKEGYCITSVSVSRSKWLIVMSQNSGYTSQTWLSNADWSQTKAKIKQYWDRNYYITNVANNGGQWLVVMSKGSKFTSQKYMFATTEKQIVDKISAEWSNGYNLMQMEYGGGEYMAVMVKYSEKNSDRRQTYITSSDDVKNEISKQWNDSRDIAYVCGGIDMAQNTTSTSSNTYASNNTVANNNNGGKGKFSITNNANGTQRIDLPDGGFRINNPQPDGSILSYEEHPCIICHGSGKCTVCWGTGGRYANGIFYPCNYCCQTNKCKACSGKGKTTLTSTYRNGVAIGVGNDGRTYMGTADGSNSRSSERRSERKSSSSKSKKNEYFEYTEDAPNYTGLDRDLVWCEKCKSWGNRHAHIRKRIN